ncbi:glycosyltransferase [Rufibacter roseolus]|uniref:glycosyltransferase n=1 Tax=Rufibacter roseolus TaxID=2817375 RepID=UPI001B302779|nr:glycosyltransferase [Rufibacter roseolus]
MKVAVVVKKFPVLSETFIINHITSLIDKGVDVKILAYQKNISQPSHPQYVKYNLQEITTYSEFVPKSKIVRLLVFFKLLINNVFFQNKFSFLKTLDVRKFGFKVLDLDLFFKAQFLVKEANFDIIHSHYGPIADDIRILKEIGLIKGKTIVSFHGYDFLKKDVLKRYKNYQKLFKEVNGVVANSLFTKDKLIDLGADPMRIEVIPVIPSFEVIGSGNKINDHLDGHRFKILTVARLEEVKGVQYGIEAAFLFRNKFRVHIHYDIIGGGSCYNSLLQKIKDYNMEDSIFLHGPKSQDEIASYYQNADVFVLPSIIETQGLVLLEAQMNGLPVIASRSGGIPESLIENETGLLVDKQNAEQIANAMFSLYSNPSWRMEIGGKSKNFVRDKFGPNQLTDKLLSFYHKQLDL